MNDWGAWSFRGRQTPIAAHKSARVAVTTNIAMPIGIAKYDGLLVDTKRV